MSCGTHKAVSHNGIVGVVSSSLTGSISNPGRMETREVTIGQAITFLLQAKRAANFRPKYVNSLRLYLNQFARGREDSPLSSFTVECVEGWFAGRAEALSTQSSNAGRLSSLFAFGERRGWIEKNPMRSMEKVRVDQKSPKILSVPQCQRLMEFVMYQHPRSLAFFSLALFGGIRPEELEVVGWDSVQGSTVIIDAAASKVRRRRIVHLRDNAAEWIGFARDVGSALPFPRSSRARRLRAAAKHLGCDDGWPQDVMRHSCASYWIASTPDLAGAAIELGNSPSILLRHYRELVTADAASAFWSIRP